MDFKFGHTYIKPIRIMPNWELMEDNKRMVFRIPVGDLPENVKIEEYLRRIVDNFKHTPINVPIIDSSGSMDASFHHNYNARDYFLPTRHRNPDIPDLVIVDHISLLTP